MLISAHITDASAFENLLLNTLLRGPLKARVWEMFYKSWYPSQKPADIEAYSRQLRENIASPQKARAARATLTASRAGLETKLTQVRAPTLVIMGGKDNHFKNPVEEARLIADKVSGTAAIIEGAGHYPHAEMPAKVAPLILEFLESS